MKKILFFINTLKTGGAERVLIDLVSKLPADQYEITVQSLVGGRYEKDLPQNVVFRKIVNTGIQQLDLLFTKILSKLPKLTGRLFVKNNYDIEVAYLEGVPTKIISSRTRSCAKKIAFVHIDISVIDFISPKYPSKSVCLSQYSTFDRTCFVSVQARESFLRLIGPLDNTSVIHNVINFDRIRKQALEPIPDSYATGGTKLIAVGRLAPQKGFERLIRICADLEKEFDFELLILGDGELRQHLENVIAETGARSVRLMGMQPNPYPWMKQADLLICSSFAEGYSTTIMEALSLGVPVLTTACGGMEEILDGETWGKLTGLSDEDLKEGIKTVLTHREMLDDLVRRAQLRKEQLTDEASVSEYLQLFDSLLK